MPRRQRDKMQVELYPYTTLALQRGGWSIPHTGHFTHETETQYPLYTTLAWTVQIVL